MDVILENLMDTSAKWEIQFPNGEIKEWNFRLENTVGYWEMIQYTNELKTFSNDPSSSKVFLVY